MKVVFLHPPMYPVCVDLFNIMGKFMDLTVCQIGEYPSHHTSWTVENLGKYIHKGFVFSKKTVKNKVKTKIINTKKTCKRKVFKDDVIRRHSWLLKRAERLQ